MVAATGRTDLTLALLTRTLEKERCWLDEDTRDVRALSMLVRYDRRTGKPTGVDLRPQIEST